MIETSPQITVGIIIHRINQLEITILHQVIINNIICKEIILHHQFIKIKVKDKTFRHNSIKIIRGGWNQNRRWNDRGGYNGHGVYSNRGNYGYGRSRDATSENWRRNPGQGLNGNQNNRSTVGNQQTLNNDSGGNRYRTNPSDKNNLN